MAGMSTTPSSQSRSAVDARREGGERTRRRLVEAALKLIAERGETAVRLRDLTTLAETNVAAVHYHFGSLGALLAAAASEAVEQIIDAQVREVESLGAEASLHQIAAAYFRPMIEELTGPSSRGRPYVRVVARVASDPPRELHDWAETAIPRAHEALLARLRPVLPGVPDDQLLFRVKCVGGILVLLSTLAVEPDLRGRTPEEVEAMIVPVVAGALAGG